MGFSETTRKIFNSDFFIYWFIGFTEGDGSFIVNKDGTLEFKVTQSSSDAQVLFYIKKQLGFGSVSVQDKFNKTHHFRVRKEQNLFNIICYFNRYYLRTKNYFNWLKVYNLVISKKHLTSFGLDYIFLLVKRINKNFKYN